MGQVSHIRSHYRKTGQAETDKRMRSSMVSQSHRHRILIGLSTIRFSVQLLIRLRSLDLTKECCKEKA